MTGIYDLDPNLILSISSILKEEDSEYDKVFKAAMDKFGISDPSELSSDDEKKEFFNYVDSQYTAKNESNELKESQNYSEKLAKILVKKGISKKTNSEKEIIAAAHKEIKADPVMKKYARGLMYDSDFISDLLQAMKYVKENVKRSSRKNKINEDAWSKLAKEIADDLKKRGMKKAKKSEIEDAVWSYLDDDGYAESKISTIMYDYDVYSDVLKMLKEGAYYTKQFPSKQYKIVDNCDIKHLATSKKPSPTYYEAMEETDRLDEESDEAKFNKLRNKPHVELRKMGYGKKKSAKMDFVVTYQGKDLAMKIDLGKNKYDYHITPEGEKMLSEGISIPVDGIASSEPDSALYHRDSIDVPKRVDVVKDVAEVEDDENPAQAKSIATYRLWCQYVKDVAFFPPAGEPGVENIDDLLVYEIPGAAEAVARAKEFPVNKTVHSGIVSEGAVKSLKGVKNYYPTMTAAIQDALSSASRMGYEVDDDDYFNTVTTGPAKPSVGNTNRYSLLLKRGGKEVRERLQMQIYRMDSGSFELNAYIA